MVVIWLDELCVGRRGGSRGVVEIMVSRFRIMGLRVIGVIVVCYIMGR